MKAHGLKYQTTLFPNGMVTGVYGTSSNNNDLGVLNLSRLTQHLEDLLFPDFVMGGGLLPVLFGDAIFLGHNYSTIITCYDLVGTVEEQQMLCQLNFRMSTVEHMYGQLFNLFHLLKTPHQLKLYNNGQLAYRTGVVSFFSAELLHLLQWISMQQHVRYISSHNSGVFACRWRIGAFR
jgi:hypothetical protein